MMLRDFEDRTDKREHPTLHWMLGALSALILLALIVGVASSIAM
jgi:hypothetical protein